MHVLVALEITVAALPGAQIRYQNRFLESISLREAVLLRCNRPAVDVVPKDLEGFFKVLARAAA